ncbi:MAG: hypothetical protein LBL66_08900 [Clostridiales bacterium]|jgi:regulator of protease activity HflC (stomatin/prohibitin superfamily)|nr:hypothetical protein [Clostridiales bacterium]
MSKDFRRHSQNYDGRKNKRGTPEYGDLPPEGKQEFDRLKQTASKYEGKSESELMGELFKKVAQGKKDGTFNAAEVERFAAQLGPMLNAEQRARLQSLIKMIQ